MDTDPVTGRPLPAENPIDCPRCGRVSLFVDGIGEEFRKG
jgi:hypothetical protein